VIRRCMFWDARHGRFSCYRCSICNRRMTWSQRKVWEKRRTGEEGELELWPYCPECWKGMLCLRQKSIDLSLVLKIPVGKQKSGWF